MAMDGGEVVRMKWVKSILWEVGSPLNIENLEKKTMLLQSYRKKVNFREILL